MVLATDYQNCVFRVQRHHRHTGFYFFFLKFVSSYAFCFPLFCGLIWEKKGRVLFSNEMRWTLVTIETQIFKTQKALSQDLRLQQVKTVNSQRCLEFKSRLIQVSPFFIDKAAQSWQFTEWSKTLLRSFILTLWITVVQPMIRLHFCLCTNSGCFCLVLLQVISLV